LYRPDPARNAPRFRRFQSATILGGDWDLSVVPFDPGIKDRACEDRFVNGMTWEQTGIFDHMMTDIAKHGVSDGCTTLDEVRARYNRLDHLFEDAAKNGRFRTRAELGKGRSERGGVMMHINRDGLPLATGQGTHRFAIARILGLRSMPILPGAIHRDAVVNGRCLSLKSED
jgi:hypothetical protein